MCINRLYISVDYTFEKDSLYRAIILYGSHLGPDRSDPLRESIFKTFFPMKGSTRIIAIPKYVLIGADGEILADELPKLRDRVKLVEKIKKVL